MGFLNPPSPPSPTTVANAQNAQNKYNTQLTQASYNNVNNPYGFQQWTQGAIDPATGLPRLTLNSGLSGPNQNILNSQFANRLGIGQGIGGLLGDINLGEAPDLSTAAGGLTRQMLDRHLGYMEPYFAREDNALQNRLNVQGASDNARSFAEMQQGDNRARNIMQAINTFEPMAFSQALQNYQTPLNTIAQMFNLSNVIDPNFPQTMSTQQTAPNMANIYGTNYHQQLQNFNNLWSGIAGLGSAIAGIPLGTAAGAVPTVGSKIGGAIGGLFT